MKRTLLLILLALILAALGTHWYLIKQVESSLDRLASQLAPVGQLTWEGVRVDRHGEARIERLEMSLRDSRDPVRIELLRFSAGGPLALVGASQDLSAMRLPPRLNLNIEGLKLPVNRELDELIGEWNMALPHAAAGCSTSEVLSFYDLGELGLIDLDVDLSLSYQLVNQQEQLDLTSRAYIRQLGDQRLRLRMALDRPDHSLMALDDLLASSQLLRFEMEYLDLGFYPRLLTYCAARTGLEMDEQIDRHLQSWVDRWHLAGLQPGPLVVAGYRHFLHRPQALSIHAAHEAGLGLAEPGRPISRLVLSEMDASFSIDEGTRVNLSFEPVEPGTATALVPEIDPPPADESMTPAETDPGFELGVSIGWRPIEPRLATAHIGERAQIQLRDGQRISGRIAAVDQGFLHLTSRSRIGEFTRPIALEQIEDLQVRP